VKSITIGFSKPKNMIFPIFSWLIRLIGKTPYSHTYIRWQTSVGPSICYQAAHTTIHFLSDRCFEEQIEEIESFNFSITDEQYGKLLKYCLENCGVKYGLIEVFGVLAAQVFNLKKNPFARGQNEQFCAELVLRIVDEIDGAKPPFDPDLVTLKTLHDYVVKKYETGNL